MDAQDFQNHVVEQLATILANQFNQDKLLNKHDKCLYGDDGAAGIVEQLSAIKHRQTWWNRGLSVIQGAILILMSYMGLTK